VSLFLSMIPTKNVSRFPKTCNTHRQATRSTSPKKTFCPNNAPLEQEFLTSLESEFQENTNSKSTRRKHACGEVSGLGSDVDAVSVCVSIFPASRSLSSSSLSGFLSPTRGFVEARLNRLPPCGTGPRRPLQAEEGRPRRRRRRPLRWKARA